MRTAILELAELCDQHRRHWLWKWLLEGLSAFVVFVGLALLTGYVLHNYPPANNWLGPDCAVMSIQTAVCLVSLGLVQLFKHH